MITQPCNVIGKEHSCGEKPFVSLEINFLFYAISIVTISSSLNKETQGKFKKIWAWLGIPGHAQSNFLIECVDHTCTTVG